MNYSMIVYIIGWILAVEAALMVPSGVVAIIYGETVGWVFAATITLCLALGLPLIEKSCFLSERGLRNGGRLLDHYEYHGRGTLRFKRRHPPSGRRAV